MIFQSYLVNDLITKSIIWLFILMKLIQKKIWTEYFTNQLALIILYLKLCSISLDCMLSYHLKANPSNTGICGVRYPHIRKGMISWIMHIMCLNILPFFFWSNIVNSRRPTIHWGILCMWRFSDCAQLLYQQLNHEAKIARIINFD